MSGNPRVATFDTPREQGLRVEVSASREELVLRIEGEADLATAAVLARSLVSVSRDPHGRVVLDIADLRFIDAHCLGVICNARRLLRDEDRDLVVRSAPPMVRRLLAICELQALVEV